MMKEEKIECNICYEKKNKNDFFITICNHKWGNNCNKSMGIFHLCPFCRQQYKKKRFGFWCHDEDGFLIFVDLITHDNVERINDPVIRRRLVRRRDRFSQEVSHKGCCILQ